MKKHPTGLSTADPKRYMRDYQARRRGKVVSNKSLLEDAGILCALAEGEISTGAAAKALGIDIVSVRERLAKLVRVGVQQVEARLRGRIAELQKELNELRHEGEPAANKVTKE